VNLLMDHFDRKKNKPTNKRKAAAIRSREGFFSRSRRRRRRRS